MLSQVVIANEGNNLQTSALVDTSAVFPVIHCDVCESVACLSSLAPHSALGIRQLRGATGSTIHIFGFASLKINFDSTDSIKKHALVVEGLKDEFIIGPNNMNEHEIC